MVCYKPSKILLWSLVNRVSKHETILSTCIPCTEEACKNVMLLLGCCASLMLSCRLYIYLLIASRVRGLSLPANLFLAADFGRKCQEPLVIALLIVSVASYSHGSAANWLLRLLHTGYQDLL